MTEKTAAIILAGGENKRLGQPKALLRFGDKLIVEIMVEKLQEYFSEIIIVTDLPDPLRHLPVILTGDVFTSYRKSSLRGLHAGLERSTGTHNFVIACDMPFVNILLIEYMHSMIPGYDAVIPRVGEYVQPLHAFYHKRSIATIEKHLLAGKFKVAELYFHLNIRYIEEEKILEVDPEQKAFFNINTDVAFKTARQIYFEEEQTRKILGG